MLGVALILGFIFILYGIHNMSRGGGDTYK